MTQTNANKLLLFERKKNVTGFFFSTDCFCFVGSCFVMLAKMKLILPQSVVIYFQPLILFDTALVRCLVVTS